MRNLTKYIQEGLKVSSKSKFKKYNYYPKNHVELWELIGKLLDERGSDANLNDVDISQVTDLSSLFFRRFPHNIDISQWDVSHVENMNFMFGDCHDFNCDLSNWDIRNVKNMRYMFSSCHKFKGEGLDNWKPDNGTDLYGMFNECPVEKNPPKWYLNLK